CPRHHQRRPKIDRFGHFAGAIDEGSAFVHVFSVLAAVSRLAGEPVRRCGNATIMNSNPHRLTGIPAHRRTDGCSPTIHDSLLRHLISAGCGWGSARPRPVRPARTSTSRPTATSDTPMPIALHRVRSVDGVRLAAPATIALSGITPLQSPLSP